ncbi:nitrogenase molybdenum-iron protein alpha chain [Desulfovibrio sulfodismutans]|uniref:Nitrogenase protein alpha chain n=1 Tax=Desulfolutivibrio sulfodismutans TaxID=63561 RepID=A0A7K3NMY5_9BACT|nr:nitrogenase molybdenum-iron protein alpha chain [Desulfolutivibrio sulfodismutans]NDY57556.1 nitrogenase molybdenum-iron protein alpha chain [Desulfolutivibrio sulfodismutans]QLA14281.1 nitrogenase molybdenum-iron protein alpha chain [Desulfolutivibrio sulfodismutans DSM 3696]
MSTTPKNLEELKKELLDKMPTKVARKRDKAIVPGAESGETIPVIQANVRTIPGILTQRGCTYAGCKGVVLGPTRDIVNLTHGPIGCGYYSWLTRRNQTDAGEDGDNYIPYCLSTDMTENDIVFGGEKKLRAAIKEAYDNFKPKSISVFATCPVGLIGDDIHAVTRQMQEELGITVFANSCEGYKGVSQSAGHHIANNQIFRHVIGTDDTPVEGKYKINLLGEYNIGGDAFEIERIFEKCGITLLATFSGNSTITQFRQAHHADLNTVMCHRSLNYVAEMMETKFGIPWIKINFIGAEATAKSLRRIAAYFEDPELMARVEQVIAEEMPAVKAAAAEVLPRTTGKTAMLFVGGSRAHHYQDLFREIGMETLAAGYEFAHRDDYEGRHVLSTIKVDADSRNIEELEIEPDPVRYNPRKTPEQIKALEDQGVRFKVYEGLIGEMKKEALIIDDINQYETHKIIELMKPDIFCAGIKEKYIIQKMGVPLKQLHNYDMGGPYAGFVGAVNWYHEIDRLVNTKVWSLIKAPWNDNGPELEAAYVAD